MHLLGPSLVLLSCGDGCDEWRGGEGFLSQLLLLWALKERQGCNRWTKAQRPVWQEPGEVALCGETGVEAGPWCQVRRVGVRGLGRPWAW